MSKLIKISFTTLVAISLAGCSSYTQNTQKQAQKFETNQSYKCNHIANITKEKMVPVKSAESIIFTLNKDSLTTDIKNDEKFTPFVKTLYKGKNSVIRLNDQKGLELRQRMLNGKFKQSFKIYSCEKN